jgi:membrane protein YdbS with pleckstrin-like domain
MVYSPIKSLLLRLLKAPSEPPDAPAGSYASVQVFRASPRYLTYRILVVYASGLLALLGLSIGMIASIVEGEPAGWILLGLSGFPVIGGLLFAWFSVRVDYDLRYYIVTDKSLRVREGAWVVKEMTITYANVQNMRVVQGPIQRLFGIRDLEVDTAGGGGRSKKKDEGGSGHSVKVAGVENAHEVRDLILTHLRANKGGSGLGDLDDEDAHARVSAGGSAWGSPAVIEALERLRGSAAELRAAARGPAAAGR